MKSESDIGFASSELYDFLGLDVLLDCIFPFFIAGGGVVCGVSGLGLAGDGGTFVFDADIVGCFVETDFVVLVEDWFMDC